MSGAEDIQASNLIGAPSLHLRSFIPIQADFTSPDAAKQNYYTNKICSLTYSTSVNIFPPTNILEEKNEHYVIV